MCDILLVYERDVVEAVEVVCWRRFSQVGMC